MFLYTSQQQSNLLNLGNSFLHFLESLIKVTPFSGEDCTTYHEEQEEELGIELAEHLFDDGVDNEECSHHDQLLIAIIFLLFIAFVLNLQGLYDEADRVDQEDEDSTLSEGLLERIVEEGCDEEHSII
jgi:hypothetical protein